MAGLLIHKPHTGLQERVSVGDEEFVVGVQDARLRWGNIYGSVYVCREKTFRILPAIVSFRTCRGLFNVRLNVASKGKTFDEFRDDIILRMSSKEFKAPDVARALEPFYNALWRIHEYYQGRYEASERIRVAMPAT